ncbi:MAG: right-handed parallel beta-helix repeat-containing protein [Anaerolineales bacterium]|nr:right-handed parallel beta-helix repeat-containing protein [Anaerolineales bacterium]
MEANPPQQSSVCDRYVDNGASSDGDGSAAHPWTSIPRSLILSPGETVCVRGNTGAAGRVYSITTITLASSGTASAVVTVRAYPGEKVVLRKSGGGGPAVGIEGRYWVIQDFVIDNNDYGTPAIRIFGSASHALVSQNEIRDGRYNGVEIYADSRGNRIENNHIHHFVSPADDAHCILVWPRADNSLIRWNTIHDCSGDGVQIAPPSPDHLSVADFADNVQIIGNVFYQGNPARAENAIDIKAATNLKIIGNDMSGYQVDAAVKHHMASQNTVYADNRIHDSLRGLNIFARLDGQPDGVTLQNNILYNFQEYAIQMVGVKNATIVHNTIANAAESPLNIANAGLIGGVIRNNLFFDNGPALIADDAVLEGVVRNHNGWFRTVTDYVSGTDRTGASDPGFVDSAHYDFHLDGYNQVRDAGTDVGVLTDIDGDPRPSGCCPDLGADEALPALRLSVWPQDGALRLMWNELYDPNVASFAVIYSPPPGAANAAEGASPILNLPPDTRTITLTGLTNFVPYSVQVIARDSGNVDLFTSNELALSPTDLAAFLPAVWRPAR